MTKQRSRPKKKVVWGDMLEGTSSKPLLISNWSNVQILSYCNACCITFVNSNSHVNDCVMHILLLDKLKVTLSRDRQRLLLKSARRRSY